MISVSLCYFSLRLQKAECCKMHELLLPSQMLLVPHIILWPELWWLHFSGQVGMKFGLKMKTLDLTDLLHYSYCDSDCILPVLRTELGALCCLFISGCRHVSGVSTTVWSVCPWMINKGLHFPPLSSLRSAILSRCVVSSGFRVTETSLSLFHFIRSTSLPFTQQQFISESCVFLRWKRSLRNHVDTASEYCRFIIGNESIIVVITLLKLWIRQLISSVVMMKLFGREGGDWVQGGSPGKIRSENLGGALVSNQERKRPLFTSVRRYKYYINPLRYD